MAPTFTDYTDRTVFTNSDGAWTIYKQFTGFNNGLTYCGPGYIAKMVRPNGKVIVDDTVYNIWNINDPRTGGLGCIGWQHARSNGEAEIYNRTWDVTGRRDGTNGFGVYATAIKVPPYISADLKSVRASYEVFLRDMYYAPMMTVRYDYIFEDSCVKQWVTITQLYNGAAPQAYIKEPKITTAIGPSKGVNTITYTKADVYDKDGTKLRPQINLTGIGDPTKNTIQIGQDTRARVKFTSPPPEGTKIVLEPINYYNDFNIVARANTPLTYSLGSLGNPDFRVTNYGVRSQWELSDYGMDKWAQRSNARTVFEDTGGAYCLQGAVDSNGNRTLTRQWEITRRGSEPMTDLMLHAWEGGTGYPDCLKASRAFGPSGEKYTTYICYSYGEGYVL
jgi:hypothetical protein